MVEFDVMHDYDAPAHRHPSRAQRGNLVAAPSHTHLGDTAAEPPQRSKQAHFSRPKATRPPFKVFSHDARKKPSHWDFSLGRARKRGEREALVNGKLQERPDPPKKLVELRRVPHEGRDPGKHRVGMKAHIQDATAFTQRVPREADHIGGTAWLRGEPSMIEETQAIHNPEGVKIAGQSYGKALAEGDALLMIPLPETNRRRDLQQPATVTF
jgi:hypothetical protein